MLGKIVTAPLLYIPSGAVYMLHLKWGLRQLSRAWEVADRLIPPSCIALMPLDCFLTRITYCCCGDFWLNRCESRMFA